MSEIDQIDNLEHLAKLGQIFDELENSLIKKLNSSEISKKVVGIAQYEEAIGLLTIEKSNLEQQLLERQKECNDWKLTCHEVLDKLNLAIETIQSVLNKVNKECEQ